MQKKPVLGFLTSLAVLLLFLLSCPNFSQAQQLPRYVTLGSPAAGSLLYSLGSGLAKVVSEAAPYQMTIQPYTGTSTFLPLVDSGEMDFGINNAVDLALSYRGPNYKIGGRNPFPLTPNVRLVMRGSPLMGSLVVRKDSPLKSIHDVKGKRLTGEYPAHLAVWYTTFASLANGGLTWSDVKVVPVPAVNEGIDALIQGRAEVSNHAIGAAKMKEADAAVGVRFLSLDCSPLGEERIKKAIPGYYVVLLKAGSSTGVIGDTCVYAYDLYLITHKAQPDSVVRAALKALWDNIDKLPPLHPSFKEWTRERAVSPEVTIPYHPAAVQFYKELGIWKTGMDQVQQRLLALKP
jgi:TRAP transporter TAXI family solute receptor